MDIRIRELKNITITPEILKALLDQRSEDVLCRKETQSVVQSNNSHVTEESSSLQAHGVKYSVWNRFLL